jgi:hypothetical protein
MRFGEEAMAHDITTAQPIITSERLTLRPLRPSDQGLIALYAGDLRVAQNRTVPIWTYLRKLA